MRVPHSKDNLRKHQNIHNRYIQHTYAVLHMVLFKLMMSTHSYLMVCVEIVKDTRWKTKIRDTLILQKRSVPAKVFLSL